MHNEMFLNSERSPVHQGGKPYSKQKLKAQKIVQGVKSKVSFNEARYKFEKIL